MLINYLFIMLINYQSVEWIEPRLNLSQDLWGPSNVESDEDLVPGGILIHYWPIVTDVSIYSILGKHFELKLCNQKYEGLFFLVFPFP